MKVHCPHCDGQGCRLCENAKIVDAKVADEYQRSLNRKGSPLRDDELEGIRREIMKEPQK